MKKLITISVLLFLFSCEQDFKKVYRYRGTIIEKGYEEPTSGYKSSRDPVYFVILFVDSARQAIRVETTVPTWYSLKKGDRTTFLLSNMSLYHYGNTKDHNKNLYGK